MKKCYVLGFEGECELVALGHSGAPFTVKYKGETYNIMPNMIRFEEPKTEIAASSYYVPPKRPDILKLEEAAKVQNELLSKIRADMVGRRTHDDSSEERKNEGESDKG